MVTRLLPVYTDDVAEEIRKFDPELPVGRATNPPATWYTQRELFLLEKSTVFANHWQFVGRVDQLRATGDYFTGTFLGDPYVVTRDEDGDVRAYHNVCRHRGTCVARGEGKTKRFVCPYHGWTYALDGRLLAAPRMDGAENFDCAEISLAALPVSQWGPFVFLHFGTDRESPPPPVESLLRPLQDALDETGFESLRFVTRRSYPMDCNWKVFVDNYLDGGYHVPHMHKGLAAQLDLSSYRNEVFDSFSIQYCAATSSELGSGRSRGVDFGARLQGGSIYAWIHPNLMINRYGEMMDVNWVIPRDENSCEVVFDYFFDPAALPDEEFVARSLDASDQVQQEDMDVCRMVQEGLGSMVYRPGRYAPNLEVLAHRFHQLLAGDFAAASGRS